MQSELTILCSQAGLQCWEWDILSGVVGQGHSLEILQQSMQMLGQNLALRKLSAGSYQRRQIPHSLQNVEVKWVQARSLHLCVLVSLRTKGTLQATEKEGVRSASAVARLI